MDQFIHQIRGLFILDNEGKRLFSKVYNTNATTTTTPIAQDHLERTYFAKTQKSQNHGEGLFECFFRQKAPTNNNMLFVIWLTDFDLFIFCFYNDHDENIGWMVEKWKNSGYIYYG